MTARAIIEAETPKNALRRAGPLPGEVTLLSYEEDDPSWIITQKEADWMQSVGLIDKIDAEYYSALGCYDWDEINNEIRRIRGFGPVQ